MSDEPDTEEFYGIDIANAHARAEEIIPDAFFWDCFDELSPFGSCGRAAIRTCRLGAPYAQTPASPTAAGTNAPRRWHN